jgi:hypothetical protein
LKAIALITVFVSFAGEDALSPSGDRWVIRLYASTDDLEQSEYPADSSCIASYPATWALAEDNPAGLPGCPEDLWIDYIERTGFGHPYLAVSKVGGYGRSDFKDSPNSWIDPDFVFQILTQNDFPWLRGLGGVFSFRCSDNCLKPNNWQMAWEAPSLETVAVHMPVVLGCEIDGVHIYTQMPQATDTWEELGMSYGTRSGVVRSLCDLLGLVRIDDAEMALRFVRLRTCGYMHDSGAWEREILTKAEFAEQPGWYRSWPRNPLSVGDILKRTKLDPASHRQLGFEPATVEVIETGYRVTRWTYSPAPYRPNNSIVEEAITGTYQKIEETIAPNGAYSRRVINRRSAG